MLAHACGARDHVALAAPAGSGKTLAYILAAAGEVGRSLHKSEWGQTVGSMHKWAHRGPATPGVLALHPTRESAEQGYHDFVRYTYDVLHLRIAKAIGGDLNKQQICELSKNCDVLVGCPGRVCDYLEAGNLHRILQWHLR